MSSAPVTANLHPPQPVELGNYILTDKIGHGAHGTVYRGYHKDFPTEVVAVKVIDHTASLDTLLIEPELLSRLQHPNIVDLKDYFLHAGKLALVLEYIDGVELETYIQQHRFSPSEVREFLVQIASALQHAHVHSIIHRDLKPSNILVTDIGGKRRYVLADFGVSRLAEGFQTVRRVAGTYNYMAPEQLRGRATEQSDVWALGVIAYILLTGRQPFKGQTLEEISRSIFFDMPPSLGPEVRVGDPDLEILVFRLLEKQLVNRVPSATNLLGLLHDAHAGTDSDEQILKKLKTSKALVRSHQSWEEATQRRIRLNLIWFGVFAFLSSLPFGLIGGLLMLGGLALIYLAAEKQKPLWIVAGFGFIAMSWVSLFLFGMLLFLLLNLSTPYSEAEFGALSSLLSLVQVICAIAASHFFIHARWKKRDLLLHQAIQATATDRETLLRVLSPIIDVHYGDLYLHQKYAELLYASGRTREMVVEAKLMLDDDPYNFGASILLAHGYLDLGLYRECIQVCDSYIAAIGGSFEFADLKQSCLALTGEHNAV